MTKKDAKKKKLTKNKANETKAQVKPVDTKEASKSEQPTSSTTNTTAQDKPVESKSKKKSKREIVNEKSRELCLHAYSSLHAPIGDRLRRLIVLKTENVVYCSRIVGTPLFVNHANQEKSIVKCVNQMIARKEENLILEIIEKVLKDNSPILIQYDMIFLILARCLFLVRQEASAQKASQKVIDFRKKVLELAVNQLAVQNSERFLLFVSYLRDFDSNSLHNRLTRNYLRDWYTKKEPTQLVTLIAKDGVQYRRLTHSQVLRLLFLGNTDQPLDRQLAFCVIHFGFQWVNYRLVEGKFCTPKVPAYIVEAKFWSEASENIKKTIQDFTALRSENSRSTELLRIIKEYNVTNIGAVNPKFYKNFKVNHGLIETQSLRALLQDTRRLRKNKILRSSDLTLNAGVTTDDKFVQQLTKESTDKIHPAEVFFAYHEYAVTPRRILSYVDKLPSCKWVEEYAQKSEETLAKLYRPASPKVVKAFSNLYRSSFANLCKNKLKLTVCLDLQQDVPHICSYESRVLSVRHAFILFLECLFNIINEPESNIRLVSFDKRKIKPIVILDKHKRGDFAAANAPAEDDKKQDGETDKDAEEDGETKAFPSLAAYEEYFKFYANQVENPDGLTFHKLMQWSLKQHWQPNVIVVLSNRDNISLYKANQAFSTYLLKAKKSNAKLITFSPAGHLRGEHLIHRKNMLHIVGMDEKITHIVQEFLDSKLSYSNLSSERGKAIL